MKKLLIALLLVSGVAHSEQWLVSKNSGGGEIVLTSITAVECSEGAKRMYSALPSGTVFYGCWTFLNERFHILFDSGSRYVYDAKGWELKGDKK